MASKLKVESRNLNVEVTDPEEDGLDGNFNEWQALSETERDSRYNSILGALNVDGAWDSSSDDEERAGNSKKKAKRKAISSSEEEGTSASATKRSAKSASTPSSKKPRPPHHLDSDDSDLNVSDFDLEFSPPRVGSQKFAEGSLKAAGGPEGEELTAAAGVNGRGEKSKYSEEAALPDLDAEEGPSSSSSFRLRGMPSTSTSASKQRAGSDESQVKRIIPPREPASRGKRARPTLIVCPTSLISHWCSEIDTHVDRSVELKVRVHQDGMS